MTHRTCSKSKQAARYRQAALGALFMSIGLQAFSAPESEEAQKQRAHDIFKQLIEINTTDSIGSTTVAAQAMAQRLLDAGFPSADVVRSRAERSQGEHGGALSRQAGLEAEADPDHRPSRTWWRRGARTGAPIPFSSSSKDGYYYGRGTQDMKDSDAIAVTDFIRLRKEGFVPDRDIILALTADEEGRQVERRRLAAQESSRPDRRRIRAESGLGRRCGR